MKILGTMNVKFIEIRIPDDNCKRPPKKFNIEYMMIMFAYNEDDNQICESCRWTPRFTRCIKQVMKVTLNGTKKKK